MVVVVSALLTEWLAWAEVEPLKFVSPAYAAVRPRDPVELKMIEQVPAATVPTQLSPDSAVTVTLPVGVPLPGETTATEKLIGTD